MKSIGNIFLTWRKGKGARRISVGVIKMSATNGVTFSYLDQGVEDAQKFGFTCYEGFPKLTQTYSENVLSIFGQRLMRSERNDISDFYKFWLIDQKEKENICYMLAFTQGMLPTDNYEFLADFNPKKGLEFITEIAGLSKSSVDSELLKIGDTLRYELEKNNEYDNKAVKVFYKETYLGYIKAIHNKVFYKTNREISVTVHHIEKNGILKRVFLHLDF